MKNHTHRGTTTRSRGVVGRSSTPESTSNGSAAAGTYYYHGLLGPNTARHVIETVSAALNKAVKRKLIKVSPAIGCDLPRPPKKEKRAMNVAETESLWDAVASHSYLHPLV